MKLWNISNEIGDPVWMMPLWEPMKSAIKSSSIADFVNAAEGWVDYSKLYLYSF